MCRLCKAEILKSKHTFQRPFLLIGPVVFGILLLIAANVAPWAMSNIWDHYSKMIFNMWTMAFNTMGISLLCILSEYREKKVCSYRLFYVESGSLKKLWLTKISVLAGYSFVATALLTLFVSILVGVNGLGFNIIISIIKMGGLSWLMSLPMLPIVLYLTLACGVEVSLGIGVLGLITSPIMAAGDLWVFNPYSYAVRAIVPITRIHPNGVNLSGANKLLEISSIRLAVILTFILVIMFSMITSVIFSKREVR